MATRPFLRPLGRNVPKRVGKRRFAASLSPSAWQESTFAELAWDQSRGAATRWGIAGTMLGLLFGLVAFAPASWLAGAIESASGQRVLLADARGTVWSGSAVVVLTGVSGEKLRSWLGEARSGARARPVDAQLTRGPQGYAGTILVSFGGGA